MKCVDYVFYHTGESVECKILPVVYDAKNKRKTPVIPLPADMLTDIIPLEFQGNLVETGVFDICKEKRMPHYQKPNWTTVMKLTRPDKHFVNEIMQTFYRTNFNCK